MQGKDEMKGTNVEKRIKRMEMTMSSGIGTRNPLFGFVSERAK